MSLKKTIKHSIQCSLQGDDPAFVVASMGRSGSTLVHDAIAASLVDRRFSHFPKLGSRLVREWSWTLGEKHLYRGVVYKTHDFPQALMGEDNVKAVFVFGSAVDACLSVYSSLERFGRAWVEEHFRNLKSSYGFEDLLTRDALRFEEQVQRWSAFEGVPVLCIRYDSLWENIDALCEFCGFAVQLPKKRPRTKHEVTAAVMDSVERIYGPIDQRISVLPELFIANERFLSAFG